MPLSLIRTGLSLRRKRTLVYIAGGRDVTMGLEAEVLRSKRVEKCRQGWSTGGIWSTVIPEKYLAVLNMKEPGYV